MREILFRGKRVDNGEWVEGYFGIKGKGTDLEKCFIVRDTFLNTSGYPFYFEDIEVVQETVGQFTGLLDINGKKIFEHDIVSWTSCNPFSLGEKRTCEVNYVEARFWCYGSVGVYLAELMSNERIDVIGNIHDNPELLTKKKYTYGKV